jgi:tRNA A37 N6-isopentenylltransferase MiaA
MTSTPFEPSLRDKVFEICENLYKNSEKITRKKVRDVLGGGSYEYISPLVTEWKNLNSVQNQETESTETEEQSNIVVSQDQSIEQVPEELYATSTNADFLADDDMSTILRQTNAVRDYPAV